MLTRTPAAVTPAIQRLAQHVSPGRSPTYLAVTPEPGAAASECFPNVTAKIGRDGGTLVCGWQLWEWPGVLLEAEFHGVWCSPTAELVDITPKHGGETRVLFVPDPRRTYRGRSVDNVRIALRDDPLVHDFIAVAGATFRVMNRGDRAFAHGPVAISGREIQPLLTMQALTGEMIKAGLKAHSVCGCGSGRKYKRCHGRLVDALARA